MILSRFRVKTCDFRPFWFKKVNFEHFFSHFSPFSVAFTTFLKNHPVVELFDFYFPCDSVSFGVVVQSDREVSSFVEFSESGGF